MSSAWRGMGIGAPPATVNVTLMCRTASAWPDAATGRTAKSATSVSARSITTASLEDAADVNWPRRVRGDTGREHGAPSIHSTDEWRPAASAADVVLGGEPGERECA